MDVDFRVYSSWRTHRKRKRLRRELGAEAVLAIEDLWSYAAAERTDGVLRGMSAQDIADEVDYDQDADILVSTLVGMSLLDVDDNGVFSLHNWETRQPWAFGEDARKRSARAAAEMRWHKAGKHIIPSPTCPACTSNAGALPKQCSNLPFPSLPIPSLPHTPEHSESNADEMRTHDARGLLLVDFQSAAQKAGVAIELSATDRERWSRLMPVADYELEHAAQVASAAGATRASYMLSTIEGQRRQASRVPSQPPTAPRSGWREKPISDFDPDEIADE